MTVYQVLTIVLITVLAIAATVAIYLGLLNWIGALYVVRCTECHHLAFNSANRPESRARTAVIRFSLTRSTPCTIRVVDPMCGSTVTACITDDRPGRGVKSFGTRRGIGWFVPGTRLRCAASWRHFPVDSASARTGR